MKRILFAIFIAAMCEQATTDSRVSANDGNLERIERAFRELQLEQARSPWQKELLERRMADQKRREFIETANRFAAIWKRTMANYSGGVFNVKDARELSKAFRELEATGWPK